MTFLGPKISESVPLNHEATAAVAPYAEKTIATCAGEK
jgi:hypothetical protein